MAIPHRIIIVIGFVIFIRGDRLGAGINIIESYDYDYDYGCVWFGSGYR